PPPAEHWPEYSFVAALAAHDAVAELAPGLRPQLAIKWPNDLLLAAKKFVGLLVEGEESAGNREGLVAIGVGVNCVTHPTTTDYPATNLAIAGADVSAEALFLALSVKMLGRLAQWNNGEHFSTIRTDWLARAAGLGGAVRVRLSDRELVGRFETLDDAGRLVLALADGRRQTIAAGDLVALEDTSRPRHDPPGGEC